MLIELLFIAENFQCGDGAPLAQFEIIVEEKGDVFHTLTVGQSIVMERADYVGATINPISNGDCMAIFEVESATVDSIPDLPGLYNQPDVASYLTELQGAEEIYLYEFGSTTGPSADYQDVVVRIDWNYGNIIYAD